MSESDELKRKFLELQSFTSDARIKIPGIESVLDEIENMQKCEALEKHPYKIWFGSDNNWHTYLPDEKEGRVPRKSKNKAKLEQIIVDYWAEQSENPTIQEIFTEWIDKKLAITEIAKPTYDRYWVDFNRFFSEFGTKKIKQVTELDIEDFLLEAIGNYSLTAKSFSNLRTLVYGIFKRAKKRKLISYSISEIVNDIEFSRNAFKRVIKEDYQEVFMEDEERLIHLYLTSNPDILNLGILLLFGTGLRVGELVTIMPQQDIEGNVIHVRRTETRYKDKHGKNIFDVKEMPKTDAGIRDVIIPKDYLWVLQKIEQLNPSGEYLLMKNGTRVRTYTIRKRLSKVCELTKIYKKSPHKIRKTYGTILLDNDVDTTLIISQMGHTNILCTEKHYHRNRKDIDKKALVLDSIPDFMAK